MRKLLVGFFSLGIVLAGYVLYTGLTNTPVEETGSPADPIESAPDSNVGDFDNGVGKIGDLGLGPVRKARYITLNRQTKAVEREWGFEELLSKGRDFWELEKPYINVYERNFKCYITADKGQTQVDNSLGKPAPKGGRFSGNVVIHVLPSESSGMKESHVYLDDIAFLSDKSQLSTAGPVEFVSADVHMLGRGLEIIYNDQSNRLELFRIVELESLDVKGSKTAMFSSKEAAGETAVGAEEQKDVVLAAGPKQDGEKPPEGTGPEVEQKEGVLYRCVFSRNVLIDTPEELIFADRGIIISDILWSGDSAGPSGEAEPGDANDIEVAGGDNLDIDPNTVVADNTSDPNAVAAAMGDPNERIMRPDEPNGPPEETIDVVITCDNGLVLVPMDTARPLDEYLQDSNEPHAGVVESDSERSVFLSQLIGYNAVTGDVLAQGLSQLTFYARDAAGAEANEPSVPTKITAQDSVEFFQARNQIVFKGNCRGIRRQEGLTVQKDVTFASPEVTVDLPMDKSQQPDVFAAGPARLTFYVQDANDPNAVQYASIPKIQGEPIPVTVTAQKQARFSAATNQIIFEDDCRCMTTIEDPNGLTEYMLLSELITVDLPEDVNDGSFKPAAGIERLVASGGVVRLVTVRKAWSDRNPAGDVADANAADLLGGVELKCGRAEYDPVKGLFTAAGAPAEIRVDNSRVEVSDAEPNGLSLSKPCYVVLKDFDTLKYFIRENRIVADAGRNGLLWLQRVPIVDGAYDLDATMIASAPHVEAFLIKTADGRTELSTLTATGGIAFEDDAGKNTFFGGELFYDHKTSVMKIRGDSSNPCLCNGALVDKIEYNVTTGQLDFDVVGPGAVQIND